jgi:carbonic anhydrase
MAVLHAAIEANVRQTVSELLASPEGRARREEGKMKLVGAIYEFGTGRVRFLD